MRKILLSAIYLFASVLTFAQTNPVKVTDFFDDFEIKPYNGNVMDTVYNTGNDVVLPVFMRFKLKGPFGSGNFTMVPQKSFARILFELTNGFDYTPHSNAIDLSGNEWRPMTGSLYSPYVVVNLTLYKEYLGSGKLKTHFKSDYDAVNNSWNPGIVAVAKSTRNITVINVPNFIGPSQLCGEATYTIERPSAITLENATGIATLTALGNNQWKVTKIGSNSGTVQLVSTSGGKRYTKSITVGTLPPRISGPQTVTSNNSYTYSVYKSDPNSTLSIEAYAGPGMPYTLNVVGNQITLNTNSIGGNVRDYYIQLKATETNSCGTSIQTVYSVRFRGGDGPIN
ncbi:hypothetical protein AAW12_08810 [Sphingobacterium sp. Ag1]|uniref:hypothetical protein n=1 Tax=Sphingobacterium sp. Ag1 TaxID=1643451 RepID=UPI00062753E5|nr:hypothetical protein [Sphingobacterium sp. Ag1]KKO91752.1 hypothetical protein AAW12_08810 [Sphingobacterium sp. Ag1]